MFGSDKKLSKTRIEKLININSLANNIILICTFNKLTVSDHTRWFILTWATLALLEWRAPKL